MHSNNARGRRDQDSRSPTRTRDRSPALLPRGSQPQAAGSRTNQTRRKTHQHELPPPYPVPTIGVRDDRREDPYGPPPVDAYAAHRHEGYYERPEESWARSSHYQPDWSGRSDYAYHGERGWMPPSHYPGEPGDRWVPHDSRHDHRYEPREQAYSREESRPDRQPWPVDEGWMPPRIRDPINNWLPPARNSTWTPRKEPPDNPIRKEQRVWQPAPNWQERRQTMSVENDTPSRSRHDNGDRQGHSYRADDKADTEAQMSKNHDHKSRIGKSSKRQRSPSPARSRSTSRSPRSRPPSPVQSRSPKRRRHDPEESRDKRDRDRQRNHSPSRDPVKAETRDRGRKRQRSLSRSSSRSRSPVDAPRTVHRLPGPQPLRQLPPPPGPLTIELSTSMPDKKTTAANGQPNGKRRNNKQRDKDFLTGSNMQPLAPTRRHVDAMDQDPLETKDSAPARAAGKQAVKPKATPLVKHFFPGDDEEAGRSFRATPGRKPSPARTEPPTGLQQPPQAPARRGMRQPTPSAASAGPAPLPLRPPARGFDDSARSSPRIPPASYAPSPSLPPRPLAPTQHSTPVPTPKRTEDVHVTMDARADELATIQTAADLFKIVAKVGEGTFGQVYKASNGAGGFVALKRIRMESEREGFPVTAMREIKLLQSLSHTNVLKLHEMMVSKGAVYMVCEYMDHDLTGVLCQKQFLFTPAHIKALCRQMFSGLAYLHHKGVIHRDLKGSNILLNNRGELKLADFGLARFYHKRRQADYTNRVITQWYRPPELLLGATVYGPEVDMWSAGCIMLELFTRRPIFQGDDEIHQLQVIYRVMGTPNTVGWPELVEQPWYELVKPKEVVPSQFRESFSRWLSPAGLDVAQALLAYNPKRRMSAAQALETPYFMTEEPRSEMPTGLSTLTGEWHELDSKRERAERAKQKRRAADESGAGDATAGAE